MRAKVTESLCRWLIVLFEAGLRPTATGLVDSVYSSFIQEYIELDLEWLNVQVSDILRTMAAGGMLLTSTGQITYAPGPQWHTSKRRYKMRYHPDSVTAHLCRSLVAHFDENVWPTRERCIDNVYGMVIAGRLDVDFDSLRDCVADALETMVADGALIPQVTDSGQTAYSPGRLWNLLKPEV